MSHERRPLLARRFPVHVTLRVLPHVWNLRSRRSFRVVKQALTGGAERFGMRICEFSVQGNHLHLLAEAQDGGALSHGMQGFGIRLARGLNRLMSRAGKVLADRYHARILRTPTEVLRALRYVRSNDAIHRRRWTNAGQGFSGLRCRPARGFRGYGNVHPSRRAPGSLHRNARPPGGLAGDVEGLHAGDLLDSTKASRDLELPPTQTLASMADRFSSASQDQGIPLPRARTYLLSRAQIKAAREGSSNGQG